MANGDISEDARLQYCEENPQTSAVADPLSSFSCTLLELDENKGLTPHLRQKLPNRRKIATDFVFLRILGEGAYSTVYLARELRGGQTRAIKVVQKDFVIRHQKLEAIVREKDILASLSYEHGGHPFITRLYSTFHDSERFFFVTDVAHLGDLLVALNRLGSFDVPVSRFYAAEIVVALEFVHKCGVVHRDVKPENVLIRKNGHIMLTDFGSAQIYDKKLFRAYEEENGTPTQVPGQARQCRHYLDTIASSSSSSSLESDEHHVGGPECRATFVGTAQYVSPEMLRGDQVGPPCDYWALGAIIFQMISGQAPFRAVNDFHLMNKIQKLDFSFPAGFPDVPKDFVSQLLVLDPMDRLGSDNLMDLKSHEFYNGIDWENIMNIEPPGIFPSVLPGLEEPEFKSVDEMPEPGLDEKALKRLMNLSMMEMGPPKQISPDSEFSSTAEDIPSDKVDKKALAVRQRKLEKQRQENPYHLFVRDNLIIRSGLIDKKKGLFFRRRMFLLTDGPHLFYVDPNSMELKGEVPWSPCMRTEVKNFQTFFVHTPKRIYYLFDPESRALEWCKAIDQVKLRYADTIAESYGRAVKDGTYGMNKFKKSSNYFGDKREKTEELGGKRKRESFSVPH
uniref:3-phosphoinositide-dependent protein kinase 1 n=1 Tax=Haemonchus contortus TaxID=6289 RepID=A0A7I4XUJ3_HAECO|nr:Serine threonine protein kinase-related domain containing protein [Haemonchus contortus]